jgi:hypothetical protein
VRLILASSVERKIGVLYKGIEGDFQGVKRPDQAYVVIRRCTREEYVECLVLLGIDRFKADMMSLTFLNAWYYEIQTD